MYSYSKVNTHYIINLIKINEKSSHQNQSEFRRSNAEVDGWFWKCQMAAVGGIIADNDWTKSTH